MSIDGPDSEPSADAGWVAEDHESQDIPPIPTPTTASRVTWGISGVLLGVGTILIAVGWIGIGLSIAGAVVAGVAAKLFRWNTSAPGWIAFGGIPAIILLAASLTKYRCPAPGKLFLLDDSGDPPVDCDQIVSSYLAMGVFFAMLAIAGAFVPKFVARQRRLALEERYLRDKERELEEG